MKFHLLSSVKLLWKHWKRLRSGNHSHIFDLNRWTSYSFIAQVISKERQLGTNLAQFDALDFPDFHVHNSSAHEWFLYYVLVYISTTASLNQKSFLPMNEAPFDIITDPNSIHKTLKSLLLRMASLKMTCFFSRQALCHLPLQPTATAHPRNVHEVDKQAK